MIENELAKQIVGSAVQVHRDPGPGLLEMVYEIILAYELRRKINDSLAHLASWREQSLFCVP
ncbi:MAG: hypothetical protein GXP09_06255 [Gammaproteobacteria bacterium]|nr:hypothetical protein [Gammaproteobacteria bacterium]